ncbi:AT-rich interactive domain-containing protein 2 isoform X2 [Wyeomyia smithii]|uniref:AT-rich interactive domain-containing protein 2 isoform X2 n=1 Tax=Wyeomyia smithii TaxID=174621 RepID=UPI002467C524|nr:AT-rich interactive domain-containing protein 2 isoform X2 [Wyeomyia smithii]
MTTDTDNKIKLERRNQQEEDDAFINQNSSSGTPFKEPGSGRIRSRIKPMIEKDKASFLQDLALFHEKNGTPFLRLPKICGRDIDLHRLYSTVIGRGGWLKVNAREDWDEVIEEMKLPKRCVNNEIAVKQIYIRYLDKYERVNFHGEEKDPADDEDEEKRHNRRWSARMLHSVPAVYNHSQHNVTESTRASLNMSCDMYKPTEYDKLMLSLLSPLPNEQDFAINVCTLMSNESKHTLKIDKCPKLVQVLLAHGGVFNHFTLRDMFDEYYSNIRKHSLQRFWKDCLFEKPQVLELSFDDCFQKLERDPTELIKTIYCEDLNKSIEDEDCGRLNMATLRNFLSLGSGLGTNDYIGQRVQQIAQIFRNLSFNDENVVVLGANREFLRFLIMCANARWNNLHHTGLDMLGNVAAEIDINDPQTDSVTRCLLSTISEGLEGADRGVIISCLEILSKIAQKESNEDNLTRCLNQNIYEQICLFLSLSDIMLLLYTLECIYSLTSMGEKPCASLMHVTGIIDTLVSLVTVEAQSYGPDACILMRVVETIPGNISGFFPSNSNQNVGSISHQQTPSMAQLTVQQKEQPTIPIPNIPALPEIPKIPVPIKSPASSPISQLNQISAATSTAQSNPPNVQVTSVTRPAASQSPQIPINIISRGDPAPVSPRISTTTFCNNAPAQTHTSAPITVAAKHAQQQQSQENEQFAYAWLKATFEITSLSNRIEQNEVYKLYLAANAKIGRKAVVPQAHFPRCMRTVFGGTVGPTQIKNDQNGVENNFYYEGIKLRPKPSPLGAASQQKGTTTTATLDKPSGITSSNNTLNKTSSLLKHAEERSNPFVTNTGNPNIIYHDLPKRTPTTVNSVISKTSIVTNVTKSNLAPLGAQPMLTKQTVIQKPTSSSQQQKQQPLSTKPITNPPPQLVGGGTGTTSSTSGKQQIFVTQLGGKNVVINQANVCSSQSNQPAQILQQVLNNNSSNDPKSNVIVVNQTTISPQPLGAVIAPPQPPQQTTGTTTIMNQSGTISSTTTNPSALIKSLLANKVTTVTSSETFLTATSSSSAGCVVVSSPATSSLLSTTTCNTSIIPSTSSISNSLIASNVNVHQVAQRQQLLKQKQMTISSSTTRENQHPNSSVVVTSNNPNNLTNIKVGNSTISIKPGTLPTNTVITATNSQEMESAHVQANPPPLAPLSQLTGTIIKPITNNKMLTDLLDKQTNDPPMFSIGETTVKRKSEVECTDPPAKKLDLIDVEDVKVTPKAADLYAELAGSILADEDLEDIEMKITKEEPKMKVQTAPTQVITMPVPMQRQIIVNPNNPQQMLLSPGGTGQQLTAQTTATIKTETGYQTVPVILQHNQNPIQLQKTAPVMQPTVITNPQQPTQYILATNPQGQTYVVAQQAQPQSQIQQTVLLTQSPQHGSQQKTIIILQQQPAQNTTSQMQTQQFVQGSSQVPQKVFVNQQGQQIIMTQMPRQVQHQTILASPGGQVVEKKPIYITTNQQGNTISIEGPTQQIIKTNQPTTQLIQTHLGQPQQQQQTSNQQIQQILHQSGSQTFQIIQQPQQLTSAQQTQQIMIQPQQQPQQSQIVIQSPSTQQLQPQIISQQIIQPATQQQLVGQKVLQQKVQQGQNQQIITVQKQQVVTQTNPLQTSATKSAHSSQQQHIGQLPTKTIIVQQQPSSSGTPQKQIIQVVQQKISTPISKSQPTQQASKPVIQTHANIKQSNQVQQTTVASATGPIVTSVSGSTKGITSTANSTSLSTSLAPSPTLIPSTSAPISNLQYSDSTIISTTSVATCAVTSSSSATTSSIVSTPIPPVATTIPVAGTNSTIQMIPAMDPAKAIDEDVELSWPWVCDWRGCPRKKYASANEVYMHACAVHCPDTVDSTADIYCQWGVGPNLCDNLPRKRFSLMTHLFDRHCTSESFKLAVQRRLTGAQQPQQAYPVTLVRQSAAATPPGSSASSTTSESSTQPSSAAVHQGPGHLSAAGPAALHAIKRHATDWTNAREFQDDIEGPVTKSIRLTSALILRNLVVYNNTARRNLRAYEPHLAGMAMNNVESSRTISQVLFEMNDTQHNF